MLKGVFTGVLTGVFRLDAETRPFAILLTAFFLAWAIIPPLTAPNPPMDSVEAFAWGANFELGYHKQPPLWPWHYGLARALGTGSWTFMWLSPLWVAIAHVCVWRAARHVVDSRTALWASALLQTIFFHNYFIPEFNQNIIQMGIFAGAGLFAIRAYLRGKIVDWIAVGAIIGVGMWAKYSVALCAVTIALYFLADPVARRRLAAPGPYLGALTALAIFAPHAWWIASNGAGTITYVVDRASASDALGAHAFYFAETIVNAFVVLLLPALALWIGRDKQGAPPDWPVAHDPALRRLVLALAFGPIAACAVMALVAGFRIKMAWTSPFWTFAPLALMMLWKVDVRAARWKRAGVFTACLAVFALALYAGANVARPYVEGAVMRVHFPGPALAREVERVWDEQAPGKPLRIIAGDTFEAGSAAYFAKARPLVRTDDDEKKSPWASDALKRQAGAVIVWDVSKHGETLPQAYRASSPGARVVEIAALPYMTGADIAPARIAIAVVQPEG